MEFHTPIDRGPDSSLGLALVMSSATPLLLLDDALIVRAASSSFCTAFALDPAKVMGKPLTELGDGEWGSRKLHSLLKATVAGDAAIDAYDMDLVRAGQGARQLVVNAHLLVHEGTGVWLAVAISDMTEVRRTAKLADDAVREKHVLIQELQHRVANSLQIIASVLMQSARKSHSDEARTHISDAHHRVMSVATLQRQLAATKEGAVSLRSYLADLCDSIGASMIFDHDLLTIATVTDDTVLTSEESVSLGLIVTELVINALKHAYPDRSSKGKIVVEYWSRPTGWRLTVEDDGIGMPPPGTVKPGLGTGIVDALAKQMAATVTVTDTHPGTRVALTHVVDAVAGREAPTRPV